MPLSSEFRFGDDEFASQESLLYNTEEEYHFIAILSFEYRNINKMDKSVLFVKK